MTAEHSTAAASAQNAAKSVEDAQSPFSALLLAASRPLACSFQLLFFSCCFLLSFCAAAVAASATRQLKKWHAPVMTLLFGEFAIAETLCGQSAVCVRRHKCGVWLVNARAFESLVEDDFFA